MKNTKKIFAMLIALMLVVSVMATATINASAANAAFSGKVETYVISHCDSDTDNSTGNGEIDKFGMPLDTSGNHAYNQTNLNNGTNELYGTENVSVESDSNATNGKAFKISIPVGYSGYEKTKFHIRNVNKNNTFTIKQSELSNTYICFYFKWKGDESMIFGEGNSFEVGNIQDTVEFEMPLSTMRQKLGADKFPENTWVQVKIPFNEFGNKQKPTGDMVVKVFRLFYANPKPITKASEIWFDEITIVQDEHKSLINDGGDVNQGGSGNNTSTTSTTSKPSANTSSVKPATSLVVKDSSEEKTDVEVLSEEDIDAIVANIVSGTVTDLSQYTDEEIEQIKDALAADENGANFVINEDKSITGNAEEEGGFPTWALIAIIAGGVLLLAVVAVVIILLLKKPAPAAAPVEAAATEAPAEEAPKTEE